MIETLDIEALRAIGLTPAMLQQLSQLQPRPVHEHTADPGPGSDALPTPPALLRVTEVQREGLSLHDGHTTHPGRLLPALRAALAAEDDSIAVGDWVLATTNRFGEWWVQQRIPPLSQLARRVHDGRQKSVRHVIVSNVDTALLVMGLDHDFNLRRLERYLALVRMAGVDAVVVLTKRDLCADADAPVAAVRALLPKPLFGPAADVVAVNALNVSADPPAAALAPWLQPGRTLVLLGSSGAGKSTLTNALVGNAAQEVGANRAGDSRGRHTTTARSLHIAMGGACIIDTPGLRTLRLDGDAEALDAAYTDIAALASQCRFRDCGHEAEPGCAVRDAVPAERLRSWRKLQREARRDTLSALQRKAQAQQWKIRSKASRARMAAEAPGGRGR